MKPLTVTAIVLTLAALFAAAFLPRASAGGEADQGGSTEAGDDGHFRELLQRWESLSPAKRAETIERVEQFMNLDAAQRRDLMRNYREFSRLTPSEQRAIIERYRRFKEMTAQQQDRFAEAFERWRGFDPEKKRRLTRLWNDLNANLPGDIDRLRQLIGGGDAEALREQLRTTAGHLGGLYALPPVERIRMRALDPDAREKLLRDIAASRRGAGEVPDDRDAP